MRKYYKILYRLQARRLYSLRWGIIHRTNLPPQYFIISDVQQVQYLYLGHFPKKNR